MVIATSPRAAESRGNRMMFGQKRAARNQAGNSKD